MNMERTFQSVYDENPTLFGSPKMLAYIECLLDIPVEDRKVAPHISALSITSDGFIISGGAFLGSVEDLENNLYGICEHFGIDNQEVNKLMANTTDWRAGGNAYS